MGRDILNGAAIGFNVGVIECLDARIEVKDNA